MLAQLVEYRKLKEFSIKFIARDFAWHYLLRMSEPERAAVVYEKPMVLLRQARKCWLELDRLVAKRRSSTLNLAQIALCEALLKQMRMQNFTTKLPERPQKNGVFFLHPSQLADAGDFNIIYLINKSGFEDFNFGATVIVAYDKVDSKV